MMQMEIVIRVGKYKLIFEGGEIWLKNELEEGMTLWEKEFEALLDQYFKDNF